MSARVWSGFVARKVKFSLPRRELETADIESVVFKIAKFSEGCLSRRAPLFGGVSGNQYAEENWGGLLPPRSARLATS
jgi:hypothetical protein